MDILVSVLTPSFNQGNYIGATLLSVMRQSYPAVEHIVLDGGSTDGTLAITANYAKRYRLAIPSEPDRGQADALVKGIAKAGGEILGWLNSDDLYFSTNTIAAVVDAFRRWPEIGVVYGHICLVNEENQITGLRVAPRFSYQRLRIASFIPQPATFIRMSVAKRILPRDDLEFAMDYEWWLRLATAGVRFRRLDTILACFRLHGASKGRRLGLELMRQETREAQRSQPGSQPGWLYRAAVRADGVQRRLLGAVWGQRLKSTLPPVLHGITRIEGDDERRCGLR